MDRSQVIRRKMMDMEYFMGYATALPVLAIGGVLFLCFMGAIKVIAPLLTIIIVMVFFAQPLLDWRNFMLHHWLRERLGIRENEMKTDALANHMQVGFTHVPEHYECKPKKVTKEPPDDNIQQLRDNDV